ncbi:MAG: acetate--CoA ligase family protein [Acidimicrobiia bacterium]
MAEATPGPGTTERSGPPTGVASIARLLAPRSVAVVGASRSPGTVGHQVLRNLLAGGFAGPVYPVNPSAAHVASVVAYPTVLDVPGPVDLAVVAVPAAAVPEVLGQCARAGVAGVVVLSAGFGETGAARAEAELRALVRSHGMRLVGPNCIGIVNTAVGLDATFSPHLPAPGRIAMLSQSGALGIALLERSARMGLGVSTFVSVGNKADVSGNDLLEHWEHDPATDVVLLYLESFGNPRRFARIARRVSAVKPIVAVKSGRSAAGMRAASSHTAAMASSDVAVDALFRQAGVIRVDTLDELFDMALVLSAQPLPAGPRVAIVGNSGGPGILAADACNAAGLEVVELSTATQAALRATVDPHAAVANPVDLVASATPDAYERALDLVLADDGVDAVIAVSTPTFAAPPAAVAEVLAGVAARTTKTVVGCFVAAPEVPALVTAGTGDRLVRVPAFSSPEPAARALGHAARYAAWRRRPAGDLPDLPGLDADAVRAVARAALDRDPAGGWLPPGEVDAVLAAAGIPGLRSRQVRGAADAAAAADDLGYPVVLKAVGPTIVHKSDVGGVRLGLDTAGEVAEAYEAMAASIGDAMTGGLVQEMAAPGVEAIVGVVQDPLFGPLVMFGTGGTLTELLGDRAFRILPVTDLDAAELVRSLRSSPLLFGYRGSPRVAVGAVEDVLQRVARVASLVGELAELEVNPLVASPAGAVAVDARIRVAPAPPGFEPP